MNVIPLFRRAVFLKDGTPYELEHGQTGRAAADVFGADMAECLGITNAAVYDMPDGRRVVTRPEKPAS